MLKIQVTLPNIPETEITKARLAAGVVSTAEVFEANYRAMGIANAIVGAVLKTSPGEAKERSAQLRACALAFSAPAAAKHRAALAALAAALDGAKTVLSARSEGKTPSEDSLREAPTALRNAVEETIATFGLKDEETKTPLAWDDLPLPSRDDNAEPDVSRRGKRRE